MKFGKNVETGLLVAAVVVRVIVIVAGEYFDHAFYPIQFTDIDYRVYSDAALQVYLNNSPYERQTYRYPPLLAMVLVGNIVCHPSFGKIIFALFDAAIALEIKSIVDASSSSEHQTGLNLMMLWCFNPFSIYISCRGSVDAVSSWLVLRMLKEMLLGNIIFAAFAIGFSIYFRMYPVIYLPMCFFYIFFREETKFIKRLYRGVAFISTVCIVVCVCVWISYLLCGEPYLDHAIKYHFARKDHRHNFSPMFYPTYLQQWTAHMQLCESTEIWQEIVNKIPFFCQCFLILVTSLKVYKISLPKCMLLLTMIFVAFNSVITGQYFLWYGILLPVALPRLSQIVGSIIWPFVVLFAAMGWWLYNAHKLEFLGENTFQETWVASLIFLIAHGVVIIACIKCS
jgi:phosphatidylinositol glycan class M